ncbi:MAG: anthranilate phosphoribosyltransferase [Thermoplasmata archaeon]
MTETVVERLLEGGPPSAQTVHRVMDLLADPATPDGVKAAALVALRVREPDERVLIAFAREMRRRAVPFDPPGRSRAIDVCGSGGSRVPTFNVSTASAFVIVGAGQPVIKHGNRSTRGHTGSSDLLEALGLPVATSRAFAEASFRHLGLAFLHAPLFHPATGPVAAARRMIGIPTVFNALGPLTNPSNVRFQLAGTSDLRMARRMASALRGLGVRSGLTVTSPEGADEFSPRGTSKGYRWNGTALRRFSATARRYLDVEDRRGPWGPLGRSAAVEATEELLAGAPGARRGAVLLTSAAALWVTGRADSLDDGMEEARASLDGGAAEATFRAMLDLAHSRAWDAGK